MESVGNDFYTRGQRAQHFAVGFDEQRLAAAVVRAASYLFRFDQLDLMRERVPAGDHG